MNISLERLSSAGRILFGFNGATTVTMGDITLPVIVGPVVQQVMFLVVEDLGPYNAIVGRAWLHAMKAVSSTYHQMITYLTSERQVDLLSSQLAAWQCYQYRSVRKTGAPIIQPSILRTQNSNYRSPPRAQVEDMEQLAVDPLESISLAEPDKSTYVSSLLYGKEKD